MNVAFLNPALAILLALVCVPVLIHLFARSRPPESVFSSIEFIRRIVRQTMRLRKPRERLLLALRTLLFFMTALVFLRPIFFPQRRLAGTFQRKSVVLIVDATASMACMEGAQTRFAAACAEASQVISGLSSSDCANIVWLRAAPEAVFPSLSPNLRFLQDALRRERVTFQTGSPQAAVKIALNLLDQAEGARELCIVSDFQKANWQGVPLEIPKGIDLIQIPVAHAEAANTAIMRLTASPAVPIMGEDVSVFCEVRNYASHGRHCPVYFSAGEIRQSQNVLLPEWGTATTVFRFKAPAPGRLCVSAALEEDAFPADDKRWNILEVRPSLRAGIFEAADCPDKELAPAWRRAFDALGWVHAENFNKLTDAPPCDLLLLAGWDGSDVAALKTRLDAGTALVCFPSAKPGACAALGALAGATPGAGMVAWVESGDHTLRVTDPDAAPFRIFAGGEHGDPSRGHFHARLTCAPWQRASPLLVYEDGVPALARLGEGGACYFWNLPLGERLGTWASQIEFVPFMGELALAGRSSRPEPGMLFDSGESVAWHSDHDVVLSEISLNDEAGRALPVIPLSDGNRRFASRELLKPGLYTWKSRGTAVGVCAVNFPEAESDLRELPPGELEKGKALAVTGGRNLRDMREGAPLWPWLLGLVLLAVLAEGAVLLWTE